MKRTFAALVLGLASLFVAEALASQAPKAMNTDAATDSTYDQCAVMAHDGNGKWVACWYSWFSGTDYDIVFSVSTDQGKHWTAPRTVNSNAATDSGQDALPRICYANGRWMVVWTSDSRVAETGSDCDIYCSTSVDGENWTPMKAVNTDASMGSYVDEEPDVAFCNGKWMVAWASRETLHGTGTDYDLFFATSTDNGANWTAPALLNSYGASDSGQDRHVKLRAGNGIFGAVWATPSNVCGKGTDWDIMYATSQNGATWTAAKLLNDYGTIDVGSDTSSNGRDQYPSLATDGNGGWMAVWQGQGPSGSVCDIFCAFSNDNMGSWTSSRILSVHQRVYDYTPFVAYGGNHKWMTTWTSICDLGGTDCDTLFATTSDDGSTWSQPQVVNCNALSDSNDDYYPVVATDGACWIAAWTSINAVPGTGPDYDVFTCRSFDFGASWGDNSPPVAVSDSYSMNEDDVFNTNGVLGNDGDPDGDAITGQLVSNPTHGTVTFTPSTGAFTYRPEANFNGQDTFTYRVSDGSLWSAATTVTMTVLPVNDPPTVMDDAYSVNEDSELAVGTSSGVLSNDSDQETVLTASLVRTTSNGTLYLKSDGSFNYVPNPNFFGTDSFRYEASDGTVGVATATITVNPVNDPPTVVISATPTTTSIGYDVYFSVTADDVEGQALSYAWDFGDGTKVAGGTTTTHAFQSSGAYSVSVTVSDAEGASAVATVEITVGEATVQGKKAPHAVISGPRIAAVGQDVVLDSCDSTDGDGEIVSRLWEIDGEESVGQTVTNKLPKGTHVVLLTVTDNDGLADVAGAEVVVIEGNNGNGNCSPTKKTIDPVLWWFKYSSCMNDAQAMSQVKFSTNNLGIVPGSQVAAKVGTNKWGNLFDGIVLEEIVIDDKGQYKSKDRNVQAEIKAFDSVVHFKFMQREFDDVLDYRADKSKNNGTMTIPVQVVVRNGDTSSFFDFMVPVDFKVKENKNKGEFTIFGKFDRNGI